MLVAGGTDDQPAGRWLAARRAGWIHQTWTTIINTKSGDLPKLDDDQLKVYEQIIQIKMRVEDEKRDRELRERGY